MIKCSYDNWYTMRISLEYLSWNLFDFLDYPYKLNLMAHSGSDSDRSRSNDGPRKGKEEYN